MVRSGGDDRARIARALGYPYQRPVRPYVFSAGRALPWTAGSLARCRAEELTPVLAVGSNAALEQLTRKYGRDPAVAIPVTTGRLTDHDVVFAAYMTSYGSLPATLVSRPGCAVDMAITWLDKPSLERMHQTESVGTQTLFGRLEGLSLQGYVATRPELGWAGESTDPLTAAYTYRSCLGEVCAAGRAVSLWELRASGRYDLPLSQQGIQRRLRRWMEPARLLAGAPPAASFADWVGDNTACEQSRTRITEWLQKNKMVSSLPAFEPVSV